MSTWAEGKVKAKGKRQGEATAVVDAPAPHVPRVELIDLSSIAESPFNTRKHFYQATLDELAASLVANGQTTPILVRPHVSGHGVYELAAGHRRLRAARQAGFTQLLAVVREMDDNTFLEVLTIENLQREDVHPLEEADGYAALMLQDRIYDVDKIASRVGKSATYIYDRLKLRTLIDPIRTLFFAGRITPAHAAALSRLDPAQQVRVIDPESTYTTAGGLWQIERVRDDTQRMLQWGAEVHGDDGLDGEEPDFKTHDLDAEISARGTEPGTDPYAGLKPVSVRELKQWVQDQARLAPDDETLAMDFPEARAAIEEDVVQAVPMVEVTTFARLTPEQRAGKSILVSGRWKSAPAGSCEHLVRGFHSIGAGRGSVEWVCAASRKCRTHWATEMRAKAKEQSPAAPDTAPREDPYEKHRRLRDEAISRVRAAIPAITSALLAAVRKASTKAAGPLGQLVLQLYTQRSARARKVVPVGTTADDLLRHLAWCEISNDLDEQYDWLTSLPKIAKRFGVDVAKLVKAAQPATDTSAKKTSAAPAAKKGAVKKTTPKSRAR